jgi:hypothetical protein
MFLPSLSIMLAGGAAILAHRLAPETERAKNFWWLLAWFGKGFLLPFALWTLMNLGLAWNLQPFMPEIQAAKNIGKGWAPVLWRVLNDGFFIVSSSWAAVTLAWQLAVAWAKTKPEFRENFKDLGRTSALLLALPAAGITWFGGWPLFPLAAAVLLAPIAAFAPPIIHAKPPPPMYSRAVARLKFGKYSEAEREIIHELEKCEDDFQGWMMLADLYANHFHDLKGAERTVLELCTRPETTAPQLSIALHRLADWNLKLTGDLEGARFALELICERLKGTHLARMAQLRINQLPETLDELRQRETGRPAVPLPALGDSLDAEPSRASSRLERLKAAELANACVEKLTHDPNNVSSREKLARLFAERLNKADLGIEQLNLLLDMPDQPEARRAEWLGLTAAWHLKYLQDAGAARNVLERLVREFPHTPQALSARRRLQVIHVKAPTNPES